MVELFYTRNLDGYTEEEKELIKYWANKRIEDEESLCVIYNPNCGCSCDQFIFLDRYPMSPKILCTCPVCKKGCIMEITDPIIFHIPLLNRDYSLKDLIEMEITKTYQSDYIFEYQKLSRKIYG